MKVATKKVYESYDGWEFDSKTECLKHEKKAREYDDALGSLPKRPTHTAFINGGGFIQHDPADWTLARKKILVIFKRDHKFDTKGLEDGTQHRSWVDKYIFNDTMDYLLMPAWTRFICTDSQFREWGSTYYAENPHEGTQKRLNR